MITLADLPSEKIGKHLKELLKPGIRPDTPLDIIILMKQQAHSNLQVEPDKSKRTKLIDVIKSRVRDYQTQIREVLTPTIAPITSFWINNSIRANIPAGLLPDIALVQNVKYVEFNTAFPLHVILDHYTTVGTGTKPSASVATIPWNLKRIRAPFLWDKGLSGSGILVAVIDTGVNYEHPDLASQMWDGGAEFPNHGQNFAEPDLNPLDRGGHGTACAGVIAGNGERGIQTGVATNASIMALRVDGTRTACWSAIQFAQEKGCDVISMSVSFPLEEPAMREAWRDKCAATRLSNVVHVNSSGKAGAQADILHSPLAIPNNIPSPADCPPPWLHPDQTAKGELAAMIACGGSMDYGNELKPSSGRGHCEWDDYSKAENGLIKPEICAPSISIESCNWAYPANPAALPYLDRTFSGTSAATPHVAGVLALLIQAARTKGTSITADQLLEALSDAGPMFKHIDGRKENGYGAGLLNAEKAFDFGEAKGWW